VIFVVVAVGICLLEGLATRLTIQPVAPGHVVRKTAFDKKHH